MTEVTDKMFEAALKAFNNSQYSGGYRSTHIRSAIEAALAAREPVDAGELVRILNDDGNTSGSPLSYRAADAIEELVEALKPFAGHRSTVIAVLRAEALLTLMGVKI